MMRRTYWHFKNLGQGAKILLYFWKNMSKYIKEYTKKFHRSKNKNNYTYQNTNDDK